MLCITSQQELFPCMDPVTENANGSVNDNIPLLHTSPIDLLSQNPSQDKTQQVIAVSLLVQTFQQQRH